MWGSDYCAGCGEYTDLYDHHCDPEKLKRREAALKAAETCRENGTKQPYYSTRLSTGFALLAMCGDE